MMDNNLVKSQKSIKVISVLRKLVFDLLLINSFAITILYYDFPSLSTYIPSSVVAATPVVFGFALIIFRLAKNHKIGINVLVFLAVVISYVVLALLGNSFLNTFVTSSSFIVYVILCFIILLDENVDDLLSHLRIDTYIIGILYVLACLFYSAGRLNSDNTYLSYMTLGYGMTFPTLLLYELFRKNSKKADLVFACLLSVLVLLYGNRGALLIIAVYVFIWMIYAMCNNPNRKTIAMMILSAFILLFTLFGGMEYVMELVANVLGRSGYGSRNIYKLLGGSMLVDSDREMIRKKAFELIRENPIAIRGPGALTKVEIGSDLSGANAHNMVIELWVEYGIILGTLISLFFYVKFFSILSFKAYKKHSHSGILAYAAMLQALVMLFFSGTLYFCSALWIGMVMISSCKNTERRKR